MTKVMLTRRGTLGLAVGALVANPGATTLAAGPSGKASTPDLAAPRDLLTALIKLRAGTNGELVIEWLKGVQYGVVDAVVTPLFTVNSLTLSAYRAGADGSYQGRRLEVVWHGDLATNRRLREFRSPYHGRVVQVPMTRTGPLPVVFTPAGLVLPDRLGDQRLESESTIGPAIAGGRHVWLRFDTRTRLFAPGATRPGFVYNETTTYQGLRSDVENPAITSAACQVAYFSLLGWKPWMEMGDVAGCITNNATGEKVRSVAELPADMGEFLLTEHPDIHRDPRAAVERTPAPGGPG